MNFILFYSYSIIVIVFPEETYWKTPPVGGNHNAIIFNSLKYKAMDVCQDPRLHVKVKQQFDMEKIWT